MSRDGTEIHKRCFHGANTEDILFAINETRLDPTIADNLVQIDGYSILRKHRNRNGGGVCLYLCSTINYKMLTVDVMKPNSRLFNVTVLYRPPSCTEGFFENLENIIRVLDI